MSCLLTASTISLSKLWPIPNENQHFLERRVHFSSFVELIGSALAMNLGFWKANFFFFTMLICFLVSQEQAQLFSYALVLMSDWIQILVNMSLYCFLNFKNAPLGYLLLGSHSGKYYLHS